MKRPNEPVSLLPTAEPTRDDLLFFAGFYDGEGSVQSGKRSCTMQLVQKDPELLYRARSLWGGSIHVNNRGISSWVMSGDRARRFLIQIYPYLSTRRKTQVENAGGLKLSGRGSAEISGFTPERAAARASMSTEERHRETCNQWVAKNRQRHIDYARKWQKENRELVSARQRERRAAARLKLATSQKDTSEGSTLVN